MKKIYTEAEMEVIRFAEDEVIVASGVTTTEPKLDEDELPPVVIQ